MLKYLLGNYIVSASRSLARHQMNLVLTVVGLSIGLAAAFLVALYTFHESSYDSFQPDAERTYRIVMRHQPTGNQFPLTTPRGQQHIEKIVGVDDVLSLLSTQYLLPGKVKIGDEHFKLEKLMAAPENLTDFVVIDVIHGNLATALSQPYKVALSASQALRLYGKENAVGERFVIEGAKQDFEITAIFADFPTNSHYDMNAIIRNSSFMDMIGKVSHTYVKLDATANVEQVASQVTRILNDLWQDESNEIVYYLQPVRDIHLAANFNTDMRVGGSEKTVTVSIALSILLIVISSFNYINMSVAQAGLRAKEVGVRKVLGATRPQLVIQFLTESILIALVSALLACGLVELLLPSFSELVGRDLQIDSWLSYLPQILLLTVTIGILSGLYPALFISSFSVHRVLSGDFGRGKTAILVRKSLMVLQSALSVGLIIAATSLYLQLNHLQNLSVNYAKEQRLKVLDLPGNKIFDRDSQTFYQDLAKIDGVISATPTDFDLTKSTYAGAFVTSVPKVTDFGVAMGYAGVGFNAAQSLGLQLVAGRDFSRETQSDWFNEEQGTIGIMIPESVLAPAGYRTAEEAIGDIWRFGAGGQENLQGRIIGVFKDVKIGSAKHHANPVLLACGYTFSGNYSLVVEVEDQYSAATRQAVVDFIEQRLQVHAIESELVKDNYAVIYRDEAQLVDMISIFSGLAVFLTCIGMFGLAAFSAQQRRREVGIRKVLGASRGGLMALLTQESVVLVLISLAIAFPLSFYFIDSWLNNFNERISQTPTIYLVSALTVALVTWLTVASIAFRSASVKPSLSLRHE